MQAKEIVIKLELATIRGWCLHFIQL